VVNISTIMIIM